MSLESSFFILKNCLSCLNQIQDVEISLGGLMGLLDITDMKMTAGRLALDMNPGWLMKYYIWLDLCLTIEKRYKRYKILIISSV